MWCVDPGVGYYLEDRLGSVVGLTDANQAVTDTIRYDAWGNLLQRQGSSGTAYQWVGNEGYYLDPDAGLYIMGLRYYTAGLGRFLTRDPIGFTARDTNLYRYVGNEPTRFRDPSGLIWGYGRYCGPTLNGPGAPIDTLDAACQAHDKCQATWWTCNPYHIIKCSTELCKAALSAALSDCATDYGGNIPGKEACQVAATQVASLFCLFASPVYFPWA